jgi:hypothetical protein
VNIAWGFMPMRAASMRIPSSGRSTPSPF